MPTNIDVNAQQAGVQSVATVPVQADQQIFNRVALLWRLEGDAELADEVVQIFLEECPGMLNRVREAAASADAQAIRFAAHALKGAAGNISAQQVSAAALRLEIMGREGNLAGLREELSTLEAEIARFENALRPVRRGQHT